MVYIQTVPPDQASDDAAELYRVAGPIYENLSLRPRAALALHSLIRETRATTDPRIFELVYFVTATRRRCSVCSLGHGVALLRAGLTRDQLHTILAGDFEGAGLPPQETASLRFADACARAPHETSEADVDALRTAGLRDEQILDIVLVCSISAFVTTEANALGVTLSDHILDGMRSALGTGLFQDLQVGREMQPGRAG